MEASRILREFFEAVNNDPRVGPVHISLYAALFIQWDLNQYKNPVAVFRNEIMALARISARGTFYKTMQELEEFGFIKYVPSVNQFLESLVYLMDPEEKMRDIKMQCYERKVVDGRRPAKV